MPPLGPSLYSIVSQGVVTTSSEHHLLPLAPGAPPRAGEAPIETVRVDEEAGAEEDARAEGGCSSSSLMRSPAASAPLGRGRDCMWGVTHTSMASGGTEIQPSG